MAPRTETDNLTRILDRPGALERDGWERLELHGGDYLWRQGETTSNLVWVREGALRIVVDGVTRATVGPGELIGEASMFTIDEQRTADVQASEPTVIDALGRWAFAEHRRKGTDLYHALLLEAARTLSRRVMENEAEVVARRPQDGDASSIEGGRPTRPDRVASGVPTAVQSLAVLPRFEDLQPAVLVEIASACSPLLLQQGDLLCRAGDGARSMYFVADGELDVLLGGGGDVRVGAVGPGSLLGTTALFADGTRTASLVSTRTTWVWELPRPEIARLGDKAWRVVVESLVTVLRSQLVNAHAAALRARGPRGTVPLEDAFGELESLQVWRHPPLTGVSLEHLPAIEPAIDLSDEKRTQVELVRRSIIGGDVALQTPFGQKRVVYADYTASGRSLSFIEDYLRDQVMPLYANTHSEASASGLQTTAFREEARELVATSVGADERDAVIFTGSGATGAIDRLVGILNLRLPHDLDARYDLSDAIPADERPIVFVGPYEHHSNILSWKHTIADVRIVPLDAEGQVDTDELERLLVEHADRPLKIGSFSAASNVTGIRARTAEISTLLHRHGALSFWDYAAAGPYVDIDMNPSGPGIDESLAHKDAVFISPHKFIGGPGTPGVLVLKRELAKNAVPAVPGGGTVDFVTWVATLYTDDIEAREEAGTPAILESIRCGLVFHLKDQIGTDTIEAIENDYTRRATRAWEANPSIDLVGNARADRLSITAFLVRYGDRFVHYSFVVALLNDLFGIQARGGCSCAGPYGGMLFGLSDERGEMFLERAREGWMSLKPGWSRVNFNYFIGESEFRYIVEAVHLVAMYGWALIPAYAFNPRSGLWTRRDSDEFGVARLSDLRIDGGEATWRPSWPTLDESALDAQLTAGRRELEAALRRPPPNLTPPDVPPEFEDGRWFPLPYEVAEHLRRRQDGLPETGATTAGAR